MNSLDRSREGLTWEKLFQPARILLPPNNRAVAKVDRFTDLDWEKLRTLTGKDYQGAILDIDECVAPHHGAISPENEAKILEWVRDGVRMVVYSNMQASERYARIQEAGVQVNLSAYPKPDPRGFLESCAMLELEPSKVVMIGDNPITDGGCVRAGVDFVQVTPIAPASNWEYLKRAHQMGPRRVASAISNFWDVACDRTVLHSKDF